MPTRKMPSRPVRAAAALAGVVTTAVAASPLAAQPLGDVTAGLAYARAVCAECHGVERDQIRSPRQDVASFTTIAQAPGMTGAALTAWLQTPHRQMPNLIIERRDRENVIAYILSLAP
jgi:mono/diheme cytochrome c family protein